ncbi:MAG: hypothetical protein QW727_04315 [Candidatus Pacearchaeota archaeon]
MNLERELLKIDEISKEIERTIFLELFGVNNIKKLAYAAINVNKDIINQQPAGSLFNDDKLKTIPTSQSENQSDAKEQAGIANSGKTKGNGILYKFVDKAQDFFKSFYNPVTDPMRFLKDIVEISKKIGVPVEEVKGYVKNIIASGGKPSATEVKNPIFSKDNLAALALALGGGLLLYNYLSALRNQYRETGKIDEEDKNFVLSVLNNALDKKILKNYITNNQI